MCFSSPFLMSLRVPITSDISSVFIPHILVVSITRSLCLGSFSVAFHEVFLSDGTVITMSLQFLLLLCSKTICMHSVRKQHRAHSIACELSKT